jgi:hypothetical protein
MPANTPRLALPYPVAADTADVPRDVLALATALDSGAAGVGAPIVTTLPAGAVNGDRVIWMPNRTTMGSPSIQPLWHMIYLDSVPGTSHPSWYYLGGEDAATDPFPAWGNSGGLNAVVQWTAAGGLTIPATGEWNFEIPTFAARALSGNTTLSTEYFGLVYGAATWIQNQQYTFPATGYAGAEMSARAYARQLAGDVIRAAAMYSLGPAAGIQHQLNGASAQTRLRMWPSSIDG